MEDWKVSLRVATNEELERLCGEPCVAASRFRLVDKSGEILILCGKCYTKHQRDWARSQGRSVRKDQRDSVVHELLHAIWGLMREEAAIRMLTDLLKP